MKDRCLKDPFDAENSSLRLRVSLPEEVQGGFGPQGLGSIADGLEERDERSLLALVVRVMMSFGEGDTGVRSQRSHLHFIN